ncbi:hypothetical protein AC249_AIPGENE20663 [Exaiptasia diaphana]|nr:hypothetical protein AC249_AIPGENE20663 [Exaiptasia diaphana]
MAKFKEGAVQVEHRNKGRRTVRDKTVQCIAWLEYFFKTIDLCVALESCMKNPLPKSFMLPHSYDIREWISGFSQPMRDHTKPKCFKFVLNDKGKAVMHYRNWSHEEWFGPFLVFELHLKVMIKTVFS